MFEPGGKGQEAVQPTGAEIEKRGGRTETRVSTVLVIWGIVWRRAEAQQQVDTLLPQPGHFLGLNSALPLATEPQALQPKKDTVPVGVFALSLASPALRSYFCPYPLAVEVSASC